MANASPEQAGAADPRVRPTRRRRRWPWLAVMLVVAGAAGLWFVLTGSKPLVHGEPLAGGRVTVVADGFIGAYIVDVGDGVALVDATLDTRAELLLDTLAGQGRAPADVRAIFFTHGHGDHIAGALAFPAARVYVLAEDADLVEGRRTAGNLPGRFRDAKPTGIEVDVKLEDGDRLQVGNSTFEVFAVPGHTRGSAAFLVHGVLFLGDSAAAASTGTLAAAPPVFSWDRAKNRESLHALAARLRDRAGDVDTMAFGHQGPLPGADALFEWDAANR